MTDEQPIDIHHYTRAIRKALPLILVVALYAAGTAPLASTVLSSKEYTASTTIVARDTLSSEETRDATTAGRRLETVNLLARTTPVLSLAASKLPGTTVDDLRSAVDSSVHPQANVITLSATAATPEAAVARADRVASALIATERRIELQAQRDAIRASLDQVRELRATGAAKAEIEAARTRLASLVTEDVGPGSGFQVVQAAELPSHSSSRPAWFSAIVAFFATFVLGMLFVLAREQVAPRVSSSQDLDQALPLPVLASIPLARRVRPKELSLLPRGVRDAFFLLAAAVRRTGKKTGPKIVLVVSAVRGEGRTTVAASLSQALSISGARVLAVSADLRSPRLHTWFGTPLSPGLTDVLSAAGTEHNVLDLAEPMRTAPSTTMDREIRAITDNAKLGIVPSGRAADDPTQLLFGDALPSVFEAIRAQPYDFVVVDTPPAFDVPDIRALAPHADALLVVTRTHRLRMSEAADLRNLLDTLGKETLGIVVFERNAQRISHVTPDEIDTAPNQVAGDEREVFELR